jgi:hypothetical protein
MPPKLWYGLSVGRRQSYHLPFSMHMDETLCWRGACEAEDAEVEVEVEERGEDILACVGWGRIICSKL